MTSVHRLVEREAFHRAAAEAAAAAGHDLAGLEHHRASIAALAALAYAPAATPDELRAKAAAAFSALARDDHEASLDLIRSLERDLATL